MKINLDTFLPYQLNNLATLVSNDFATLYQQQFGLNIPQWRVLANLAQFGQSTAKDLCRQANMDKSTVSRALKALLERQLISSEINPQDKRAALLMLNEQGQQLYADIAKQALAWEQQLLSALSRDEYSTLMRCFDKLTVKLQQ